MDNTTIRFPYLGIEVHPGKSIEIFGLEIAFYGMLIGLAMLVGALIAYREAKRTNQNVDDYLDFTIWTLIMAIVGARLYYVIFEWDYYGQHPLEIITGIRDGGLAIYGGIIASVLTLYIFTKVKKLKFWQMADTAVLGLVIGQVIGRWGNFFNREAFGGYTSTLFAMQLPVDEANGVTTDLLLNAYIYNGHSYIQVHPTFLYEALWNLALFIGLMIYKKNKKFHGEVFALYLVGYGIGRTWIEALRTDQLLIPNTKIPVSQVLSVLLVIAAVAFIIYNRIKIKKDPGAGLTDLIPVTDLEDLIEEVIEDDEKETEETDEDSQQTAEDSSDSKNNEEITEDGSKETSEEGSKEGSKEGSEETSKEGSEETSKEESGDVVDKNNKGKKEPNRESGKLGNLVLEATHKENSVE